MMKPISILAAMAYTLNPITANADGSINAVANYGYLRDVPAKDGQPATQEFVPIGSQGHLYIPAAEAAPILAADAVAGQPAYAQFTQAVQAHLKATGKLPPQ